MSDSEEALAEWFAAVSIAASDAARASAAKVEQLLSLVQPAATDRGRSTAEFSESGVHLLIEHISDPIGTIDLSYSSSGGGMFHALGYEEYYQLRGEQSVEDDALEDLGLVLTRTYAVEETRWKGRLVRTTVRVEPSPREAHGWTSVSGWLIPLRLLPRRQLNVRSRTVSYGARSAGLSDDDSRA